MHRGMYLHSSNIEDVKIKYLRNYAMRKKMKVVTNWNIDVNDLHKLDWKLLRKLNFLFSV